MKKRVFTFIFILIVFPVCFSTCKPDFEEPEYEYTDVVYSIDGNTVTIYLDGGVSVPRSLSRPLALMGCDYFEVNFLDDANVLTRGEWMAGKRAGVSGITRGVNYANVTSAPPAGEGSSILFAGKSDKTLMAIGRLTAVNNGSGNITNPLTITTNTIAVTFTLDAITAAVSDDPANSSFLTAAKTSPYETVSAANTVVSLYNVFHTNPKVFPCFELERLRTVSATYEFKLSSQGNLTAAYPNGIFVSPPAFAAPGLPVDPSSGCPAVIERKQPRYTAPDGNFHESILLLDKETRVTIENNNTNAPFNSTVSFKFDTTDSVNGSVFALVFSIPVYALKELDKESQRSRWYIRSSYGPNLYDLDDGTSGMGGAVLIQTGHTQTIIGDDIKIVVVNKPNKYQYPASGSGWFYDRVFDITGLKVELRYTNDVLIRELAYDELEFIIGRSYVDPRWQTPIPPAHSATPYSFASSFWGIIEVTVRYTHTSGLIVEDAFYVLVSGGGYNLSTFSKTVHIYNNSATNGVNSEWDTANSTGLPNVTGDSAAGRFESLINGAPAGTSTLVVFHNSFNMNGMVLNQSGNDAPRLFFMVAGEEWDTAGAGSVIAGPSHITVGRGSNGTGTVPYLNIGNAIVHNITNPPGMNGINAYYFGVWPFSGLAPGSIQTYPYTINTRNVYNNSVYLYDNKMLTDGFLWNDSPKSDGGIYNVKVGPGVTVRPTETISVTYQGTIETIDTYPYLH